VKRDVNTKRGPGTVYDVTLGDGTKASTFDSALGKKAEDLIGQMVVVGIESSQSADGRYTNTYLNSIETTSEVESGTGMPATPSTPFSPDLTPDEGAKRISRSVALKMAAEDAIARGVPGNIDWKAVNEYSAYILYAEEPDEGPFDSLPTQS